MILKCPIVFKKKYCVLCSLAKMANIQKPQDCRKITVETHIINSRIYKHINLLSFRVYKTQNQNSSDHK